MDVKVLATALINLPSQTSSLGQLLLISPHFLWPSEGDVARFGGESALGGGGEGRSAGPVQAR